jgi:peroxiredoxin Q/BCP
MIQAGKAAFPAFPREAPHFGPENVERMAMAKTLKEGDKAPDFDLPTDGGGQFRLSGALGTPVVIYFYPKDDTSGCTKEAIDFSGRLGEFKRAKTEIVGISPDGVASHDKFKTKHDLTITLAADEQKKAAEAYGVWIEKSMYGRKYMGVDRSTFLVDPKGTIAKLWRNVKVEGHVQEVLDAVKALGAKSKGA